jgi:RNA polymerase sigma factor (sigma-70 family)
VYQDVKFEKLHQQFQPMIYHAMKRLAIYKNEQEFYQIGCIALWEASLRFKKEKGEFKSFAYAYIIGRMKSFLTEERMKQEKETGLGDVSVQEETCENDFSAILSESLIDRISSLLTANQSKWIKAYCLYGHTPSEIANDEGVSVAAVKAWRRDAIARLRKYYFDGDPMKR